jgi:hypothetical protein
MTDTYIRGVRKSILDRNPKFGQKALDYFDSLKLENISGGDDGIQGERNLDELKDSGFYEKVTYKVGPFFRFQLSFGISIREKNEGPKYGINIVDSNDIVIDGRIHLKDRKGIDITRKLLDDAEKAYKAIFKE